MTMMKVICPFCNRPVTDDPCCLGHHNHISTTPKRIEEIRQSLSESSGPLYSELADMCRDLLAMVAERDAMIKDENIPRTYRTLPNTSSPVYCIWGTSSNTYADELEKLLKQP